MAKKDIWDKKLTVHMTLKERVNQVLLYMATTEGISKGRLVEEMITRDPDFVRALEKMREDGWII